MVFVWEEVLNDQGRRKSGDQHLAMELITYPLCCILNIILVNDVRRVNLLGTCDLTNHFVIVTVKCLSEHFPADGIELGDEVSRKKPQVVFLEDNGAYIVDLKLR
jgi:hypothetical protein